MEFWIARNERGYLWCFDCEPVVTKYGDWNRGDNNGKCICIGDVELFSEITFENSPQKVKLKFVNKSLLFSKIMKWWRQLICKFIKL